MTTYRSRQSNHLLQTLYECRLSIKSVSFGIFGVNIGRNRFSRLLFLGSFLWKLRFERTESEFGSKVQCDKIKHFEWHYDIQTDFVRNDCFKMSDRLSRIMLLQWYEVLWINSCERHCILLRKFIFYSTRIIGFSNSSLFGSSL